MAQLEHLDAALEFVEVLPGRLVVTLSGECDLASVKPLTASLDALLEMKADSVVVDLEGLSFMDSSGVAMLLRIANRFGPLEIQNANPMICRMIQALGLSEHLRMPKA